MKIVTYWDAVFQNPVEKIRMGGAKEQMMRDWDSGVNSQYSWVNVCLNCFDNPGLQQLIQEKAYEQDPDNPFECDFCPVEEASSVVANLDDVCEHMMGCIHHRFEDANSVLPYETAEGGYQGTWSSVIELLEDHGLELVNDESGRLEQQLIMAFNDQAWCRKHYFGLNTDEQLRYSWKGYRDAVISGVAPTPTSWFDEIVTPERFLDFLYDEIAKVGLVRRLDPGSIALARVRPFDASNPFPLKARELGPAPTSFAAENRMSPAGVPMFYGAEDLETAVTETIRGHGQYAYGRFTNGRPIYVLDLAALPPFPCFFDLKSADLYDLYRFLTEFALDVSKPVDSRNKRGYVPTQKLT